MTFLSSANILDWRTWAARSRAGEVCGILGCLHTPVIKCPYCGNHYCEEHSRVHYHPADKVRKITKRLRGKDGQRTDLHNPDNTF